MEPIATLDLKLRIIFVILNVITLLSTYINMKHHLFDETLEWTVFSFVSDFKFVQTIFALLKFLEPVMHLFVTFQKFDHRFSDLFTSEGI